MLTAVKNVQTGQVIIGTSINHSNVVGDRKGQWVAGYLVDGAEFVTEAEAAERLKAEHAETLQLRARTGGQKPRSRLIDEKITKWTHSGALDQLDLFVA